MNRVPTTRGEETRRAKICSQILTDEQFRRLSVFIHREFGINVESKKVLLEGRLRKRLTHLRLATFGDYCAYLFSPAGHRDEMVYMIDAVATNKTEFFREPQQFDYLTQKALPSLAAGAGPRWKLSAWSAASSTGEEPYTLGIVLSEYAAGRPGFDFSILATDISTRGLDHAATGIYDHERVGPVPLALRKKYLLKSKDASKNLAKIAPALREKVTFKRLNLMDAEFGIVDAMGVIFCRNVIIYFDRPTQAALIRKLFAQLIQGGYLFMGHSEVLGRIDVPLVSVGPSIYRKMGVAKT
jgi:chemotaxis protein methyltransferase CheR